MASRRPASGIVQLGAVLFGLFKFGKVGGTIVTMLVSLAIYTGIFGWKYAAGFIALMMIHEAGHLIGERGRRLDRAFIASEHARNTVDDQTRAVMLGFDDNKSAVVAMFELGHVESPALIDDRLPAIVKPEKCRGNVLFAADQAA